jgi:hypothetical protein
MRQILAVDAPHVPVRALNTTAKLKHHADLGFESWAARWSQGLVIVPSYRDDAGALRPATDEIGKLLEELRSYDPESHTGDRAMAAWIGDVCGRTTNTFTYAVGVAGDPLDEDELVAFGFSEDEVAAVRKASLAGPEKAPDVDPAMRSLLKRTLPEGARESDAPKSDKSWRFS